MMDHFDRFRGGRTERNIENEERIGLSRATGLIFVLVLAAVFIANLVIDDKNFSAQENRMLQTLPKFSISEYLEGRYESKLESYADDQFIGRNEFIKVKAAVDVTEGKLEANGVYRARDGYLMEEITVPGVKDLKKTEKSLAGFRKKYPKLRMYFLLAPNAANIMSDKLPISVRTADQDKYMDGFFSSIDDSGYKVIDVRKKFRKNRDKVQLYYRTDHHWTSEGAYLAYRKAIRSMDAGEPLDCKAVAVKNDFSGTLSSKSGFTGGRYDSIKICLPKKKSESRNSVIYYSDTKQKTTKFYRLRNLRKKDAYTVFGGSNHPMYTIKTPTSSSRRLLLVKDSYANCMIPLLAQHFREIVVVDPRYYFDNVNDLIESEDITDVLFLYNANTFFGDDSLQMMLEDD
jgi:hypothetical protein